MDKRFIPSELRGKDIYKILEVNKKDVYREDIPHIIRRQYLKLAVKLHPDKQRGKNGKNENGNGKDIKYKEDFNLVKSAYEFLSNATLRKKYNAYILQNVKRKEPVNQNTSLKRNVDNKKFLFQKYQKEVYKNKLEEREKAVASFGKKENNFNKTAHIFEPTVNKSNDLEKIKKENESFLRQKQIEEMKNREKRCKNEKENENKNKGEKGDQWNNEEELLEIYLENCGPNVDFVDNNIDKKFFFHFFVGFNFLDSSLDLNTKTDTRKESSSRRVGFLLFDSRKEAIRAYLYYKNNLEKFHKNLKLKLAVPCKGVKENEKVKNRDKDIKTDKYKDIEKRIDKKKEVKDSIEKQMEEMENELENFLS